VGTYNREAESRAIANEIQGAFATTALAQAGAIGLGTIVVTVVTGAAADVTGILLATALAVGGFYVLPRKRRQAQRDFQRRIANLRSHLREALTRLTEQHLLIATPQRGFRVRDLSIEDIADLTETRIQIESLALRLAVERGDLQWETGILAAHHRLERTPVTRDDGTVSEDWSCLHRDFHQEPRQSFHGQSRKIAQSYSRHWKPRVFC